MINSTERIALEDIIRFLDEYLQLDSAPTDPSNNGLQVEAGTKISKVFLAVDVSMELINHAILEEADLIIVHHGISWGPGIQRITDQTATRLAAMFKNDISLYAVHLPLDAHPTIGHNAVMASKLGLTHSATFAEYAGVEIGVSGSLTKAMSAGTFAEFAKSALGIPFKLFGNESRKIRNVGVISGGAGSDGIMAAVDKKLDCLITGEVKHESWHLIYESGLLVASGGHYATETFGLKALMKVLCNKFNIKCEFIDIPTNL